MRAFDHARKIWRLKRQPNKLVKHTQTIHRLLPTNCLNVFDHFVGLVIKGLIRLPLLKMTFSYRLLEEDKYHKIYLQIYDTILTVNKYEHDNLKKISQKSIIPSFKKTHP